MDKQTNIAALRQVDIKDLMETEELYRSKIAKSTVSKSINRLIEKQFIAKSISRLGFMVNPSIMHFGNHRYLDSKIQDFEEILATTETELLFYYDKVEKEFKYY